MYIPLLETLKFIFTYHEDLCSLVRKLGFSIISVMGTILEITPLSSEKPKSLQIQIFYDDFEVTNPLGSKHGVHKVGSIYFVLRNQSPTINSAIKNIHLLALFHTEDVKKHAFMEQLCK